MSYEMFRLSDSSVSRIMILRTIKVSQILILPDSA